MKKITLSMAVEQLLSQVIDLNTRQNVFPKINLVVTFYMDYSDVVRNQNYFGNIIFETIFNCDTNEIIDYKSLPIIAQLECNKYCRKYLYDNNLDRFKKVSSIKDYPYRYPDPENADKTHYASVIQFTTNH